LDQFGPNGSRNPEIPAKFTKKLSKMMGKRLGRIKEVRKGWKEWKILAYPR
jgi:hypothetical protein